MLKYIVIGIILLLIPNKYTNPFFNVFEKNNYRLLRIIYGLMNVFLFFLLFNDINSLKMYISQLINEASLYSSMQAIGFSNFLQLFIFTFLFSTFIPMMTLRLFFSKEKIFDIAFRLIIACLPISIIFSAFLTLTIEQFDSVISFITFIGFFGFFFKRLIDAKNFYNVLIPEKLENYLHQKLKQCEDCKRK